MQTMVIQAWLRSEMLDAATCAICADLDGIMLPYNDPRWNGPLGESAHIGCRVFFVPIYDIGTMDYTDATTIPKLITRSASLQIPETWDEYPSPVEGLKRMTAVGIAIEEEMALLEPYELMGIYLKLGEEI